MRDGGRSRGGDQAFVASLQLGEQLLELPGRGIRGALVEKAGSLTAQVSLGVGNRVELELDRLIDRRDERAIAGRQVDCRGMVDARRLLHDGGRSAGAQFAW